MRLNQEDDVKSAPSDRRRKSSVEEVGKEAKAKVEYRVVDDTVEG